MGALQGRRRLIAVGAVTAAAAMAAGTAVLARAASGRSAVTVVTLGVRGAAPATPVHRNVGQAVRLVAAATLAAGERLSIVQKHGQDAWVGLAECASSPCAAVWTEKQTGVVSFRALVVTRAGGATGRVTHVRGRSPVLAVRWDVPSPPPPPPPPPTPTAPPPPPPPTSTAPVPLAQPGHYVGKTTQGFEVAFDVTADGATVQNAGVSRLEVLERDCGAAGLGYWAGFAWQLGPFTAPIAPGGAFSLGNTQSFTSSEFGPVTAIFALAGQFSGATAAGTTSMEMKFSYQGVDRDCRVNLAWSASR